MKKLYTSLLLAYSLMQGSLVFAQCPVKAGADKQTVFCGDPVRLSAIATGNRILLDDFNSGSIGSSWSFHNDCVATDGTGSYACSAPAPEGSGYLWFPANINTPRSIESNDLNLSPFMGIGVNVTFYMKYAIQANQNPCEGIDLPNEGVALEYSTDNGNNWVQLGYWDPQGGNNYNMTTWQQYAVTVPAAGITSSTRFRWIQEQSSGPFYDSWGLDLVMVYNNSPGYKFDWLHDGLAASPSPSTPPVMPTSTTTYTVTYSNKSSGGTDSCSSDVVVSVHPVSVSVAASQSTVPPGAAVQLYAIDNSQSTVPPAACTAINDSCPNGQSFGIGNGTIVSDFNGIGVSPFGDFGDAYKTSQVLYKASELQAAGMTAGEINSIAFDMARIEDVGTGAGKPTATLKNFQVHMSCTATSVLNNFITNTALSSVIAPKSQSFRQGWNTLDLDNKYVWDGTSNLLIEICWFEDYNATSFTVDGYAKTFDSPTTYNSLVQASTNFSPGLCDYTQFNSTYKQRPNIQFGMCRPYSPLNYSWTSIPAGFSSASQNITVNPAITTTYIVTGTTSGQAQCVGTASLVITVDATAGISQPKAIVNGLNITKLYTTGNKISYAVSALGNCDALVQLCDITGKTLRVENVSLYQGLNNLDMRLQELPTGVYFLKISSNTYGDIIRKFNALP